MDLLLRRKDDPDAFDTSTQVFRHLIHEILRSVGGADDFHHQVWHHLPGLGAWHTLLRRPAVIGHKGRIRAALASYCGAQIKEHLLHTSTQSVLSGKASEIICKYRRKPYFICTHWG